MNGLTFSVIVIILLLLICALLLRYYQLRCCCIRNIQPRTHGSNCAVKEMLGCAVVFKNFSIPILNPITYTHVKPSEAKCQEILDSVFTKPYCTKSALVNQGALLKLKVRDRISNLNGVLSEKMVKKIVNAFTMDKKGNRSGWLQAPFRIPELNGVAGMIQIKGVCQGNTDSYVYTREKYELTGGGPATAFDRLSDTCIRAWFNDDNSYPALIIAPSPESFGDIMDSNNKPLVVQGFDKKSKTAWLDINPKARRTGVIDTIKLITLKYNGAVGNEKVPGKTSTNSGRETNPGKADLLPASLVLDTIIALHDAKIDPELIKQYVATCFAINIFANAYHWAPYNASIGNSIGFLPEDAELAEEEDLMKYFLMQNHWGDWIGPDGEPMSKNRP